MVCCDNCENEGMPVGPQGEPGAPAFLCLSATGGSGPFTDNTNTWVEASNSRFYFSNNISKPFTSVNINIYVSGGTGACRVKDLISGNILYENDNITSTSLTNIESGTGLNIYNSTSALIVLEVLSDVAESISIGTTTLAYL